MRANPGTSGRPLGQHFLEAEPLLARLVADAGVTARDHVVDLGAGRGTLTAAIARVAAHVTAVELDGRLVEPLVDRFRDTTNVTVLHADLRDVPLPRTPFRVVANPPWGSTSALLHRLLDDATTGLERADLVLQWQVVRARVVGADVADAAWRSTWSFRRGRRIPASLFRPAPPHDGAVLTVTRGGRVG